MATPQEVEVKADDLVEKFVERGLELQDHFYVTDKKSAAEILDIARPIGDCIRYFAARDPAYVATMREHLDKAARTLRDPVASGDRHEDVLDDWDGEAADDCKNLLKDLSTIKDNQQEFTELLYWTLGGYEELLRRSSDDAIAIADSAIEALEQLSGSGGAALSFALTVAAGVAAVIGAASAPATGGAGALLGAAVGAVASSAAALVAAEQQKIAGSSWSEVLWSTFEVFTNLHDTGVAIEEKLALALSEALPKFEEESAHYRLGDAGLLSDPNAVKEFEPPD